MNYPSMNRLAELQQLIADFAKVKRVVPLADAHDEENDVEHSYGLAMTCWYLHDKIAPELDLSKILRYALAHDIVEIHAGDTYPFDKEAVATKYEREKAAMRQIEKDWHDFPMIIDFAEGYADKVDEEAKFTYAVDKMLPVIMIELADAPTIWEKKQLTFEMEKENKVTILKSTLVAPYYEKLLAWLDERNNIPKT
ncbi:MAG TPA: HD domain-containing protein [Candidatus Saccharimonadales bacterium]